MAQVKLLKIAADGVPLEHTAAADDLTMVSFSITGGGPSLSGTGLSLTNQDITGLKNITFNSPTTNTINQTAGSLIVDNIMGKERSNLLTTAADILFPVVTDTAGQVDALRLPALAGAPTATPTSSGEGFMVWDSTNDDLWIWNGTAWDNQNIVKAANSVDDSYTAAVAIAANDAVYVSAADSVSKATASGATTAQCVGFATASAASAASVNVRKFGRLSGFTALTAGARYYLDGTTAGGITATVPTSSGHTIVQVGYAKNTTNLDIMIQNLGRRA